MWRRPSGYIIRSFATSWMSCALSSAACNSCRAYRHRTHLVLMFGLSEGKDWTRCVLLLLSPEWSTLLPEHKLPYVLRAAGMKIETISSHSDTCPVVVLETVHRVTYCPSSPAVSRSPSTHMIRTAFLVLYNRRLFDLEIQDDTAHRSKSCGPLSAGLRLQRASWLRSLRRLLAPLQLIC